MIPPNWVVNELQRFHKWARLGWLGKDRQPGEEPNQGEFVLLQLYHIRDANRTASAWWDDKGPVYGKPYDRLFRIPVMVARFKKEDVMTGAFLTRLREMAIPISKRVKEAAREVGKKYTTAIHEEAAQGAQEQIWRSKRTGATRPQPYARKFLTADEKATLGGEKVKDYTEAFVPAGDL